MQQVHRGPMLRGRTTVDRTQRTYGAFVLLGMPLDADRVVTPQTLTDDIPAPQRVPARPDQTGPLIYRLRSEAPQPTG
ncbi:hypothetical protein GCM10009609_69800 [Pseudonocardia aurantiaca]